MRKLLPPVAALLLTLLCAAACRAPVRSYACAVDPGRAGVDPHQVWDCHRDIAVRVVKGKGFSLREFDRAATFFEELTGIPADSLPTDVGRVPGKAMKKSLRGWDAWYADNAPRLEWNSAEGRIAVGP